MKPFPFRRSVVAISAGALACAGLASAGVGAASAADEGSAPQATSRSDAAQPSIDRAANRVGCERDSNLLGIAVHDGSRVKGAKVRILGPSTKGKKTTYTRVLATRGMSRTNAMGGFSLRVACLPSTFIVEVSGGQIDGAASNETMSAIGLRSETYVVITPATTLAAEHLRHRPDLTARQVVKRVSDHLDIAAWGPRANHLGLLTSTTSSTFHAGDFASEAKKAGGFLAFAKKEAKRVTPASKNSFAPADYQHGVRPGYPDHKREDPASERVSPRGGNPIVSILTSVAGKALYSTACASIPPGPVANLVCANPNSSFDQEIENQMAGVTTQLNQLNTTVSDMAATLSDMQQSLADIQASIEELQQQEAQDSYVNSANAAQSAYGTAYSEAGVAAVQSQVQEAYGDLFILSSVTPTSSTWTPTSDPAPTNAEVCGTMYDDTRTSSGDVPIDICTHLLEQTDAFVDPSNSYYSKLFEGLVGSASLPQDYLLIYTFQNMLTMGGYLPLSATDLAQIQATYAQLGQLMDSAYALAGSAQMFRESAASGQQPSCPDLPSSGSWPSTTSINMADACRILASGLFAGAVQNAVAASVVVPPDGTIADPSTNYVWWAYPVDLSVTTMKNASFPLYPGPATSTYTAAPLPIFNYAAETDFKAATPQQLLTSEPAYKFAIANEVQNLTLVGDLPLTQPTVAKTLTAQGFVGIGTSSGGMQWSNLGADPGLMMTINSVNQWQSTTKMPSTTLGCTGYPASIANVFQCLDYGYGYLSSTPVTLYGSSNLQAVFASQSWNLGTGTVPTSTNTSQCTVIGSEFLTSNNALQACWTNTFGLLVDTAAATGSTGSNFWTTGMLGGVPQGGVTAIPVTNSPVSAS